MKLPTLTLERWLLVLLPLAGAVIFAANGAERETENPSRGVVKNQGFLSFADAPINYRSTVLHDPIALLEKRLESGAVTLSYDPKHGYLKSVLAALNIPVSSQALVFSKAGFSSL